MFWGPIEQAPTDDLEETCAPRFWRNSAAQLNAPRHHWVARLKERSIAENYSTAGPITKWNGVASCQGRPPFHSTALRMRPSFVRPESVSLCHTGGSNLGMKASAGLERKCRHILQSTEGTVVFHKTTVDPKAHHFDDNSLPRKLQLFDREMKLVLGQSSKHTFDSDSLLEARSVWDRDVCAQDHRIDS
jgi:hypothetical protein